MAGLLEQFASGLFGLSQPQQIPQKPAFTSTLADLLQSQNLGAAYGNPMLMRQGAANFGKREDGSQKGFGFLGKLSRPDGDFSTELSFDFTYGGKNITAPLIVPTLTAQELNLLLSGGKPTNEIFQKASDYALQRSQSGASPFARNGEMYPDPRYK